MQTSQVTLVQYNPNSTQKFKYPRHETGPARGTSTMIRLQNWEEFPLCHKSCVTASISFIDAIGILYNLHHFQICKICTCYRATQRLGKVNIFPCGRGCRIVAKAIVRRVIKVINFEWLSVMTVIVANLNFKFSLCSFYALLVIRD